MKIYSCIISLRKASDSQIVHRYIKATSSDAAIREVLAKSFVVDLLLGGYSLNSKSIEEVDSSVAPYNRDGSVSLLLTPENVPEAVYIRVDGEYEDGFKRDLQALLSKYCPELPTVFEGVPKRKWFLEVFCEDTWTWIPSSFGSEEGYDTEEAASSPIAATNPDYRYRVVEREVPTVFEDNVAAKPKTRWFLQFLMCNGEWVNSSFSDEKGFRTKQEILDNISEDAGGNYRIVEREVHNEN